MAQPTVVNSTPAPIVMNSSPSLLVVNSRNAPLDFINATHPQSVQVPESSMLLPILMIGTLFLGRALYRTDSNRQDA